MHVYVLLVNFSMYTGESESYTKFKNGKVPRFHPLPQENVNKNLYHFTVEK